MRIKAFMEHLPLFATERKVPAFIRKKSNSHNTWDNLCIHVRKKV